MLVLARKPNQTIVIDERITVTILESKNGRATIGISAPVEVRVRRGEISRERTQGANQ